MINQYGTKHPPSETERRLARALDEIEITSYKRQYKISKHKVDFAFPRKKIAIEVDGVHHKLEQQQETDKWREYYAIKEGWIVWRFDAEKVFHNPDQTAKEIKNILRYGSKTIPTSEPLTTLDDTPITSWPPQTKRDIQLPQKNKIQKIKFTFLQALAIIIFGVILATIIITYTGVGNSTEQHKTDPTSPTITPIQLTTFNYGVSAKNNQNKNVQIKVSFKLESRFYGVDKIVSEELMLKPNEVKNVYGEPLHSNVGPCNDCSITEVKYVLL